MQAENQTGLKDKISGLENNSKDFSRKKKKKKPLKNKKWHVKRKFKRT